MRKFTFFLVAVPLLAHPLVDTDEIIDHVKRAPDIEWTAWGDSYASGVGSGDYIDGRRCLRYDGAYPIFLGDVQGITLNNAVCSGSKADDVIKYQFYKDDQYWGQPNFEYYPRPSSGTPTVGTLTIGGDDIDFPGILNNCIIEGFPWPLSAGFTPRTCDEQRDLSWSLICQDGNKGTPNADLVDSVDSVIQKIVQYGQAASGDNFRLYVTGYGQFFNATDPGCNNVTFARLANPHNDGKPHNLMTTELRQDFNSMSITLNAAIQQAVNKNSGSNVKYIDIDRLLDGGHRFCEPGVQEPDQDNPNLWLYHYPYEEKIDSDPTIAYLNSVEQANVNTLTWNPQTTLWADYLNDFWSLVDETQLNQTVGNDPTAQTNIWPDVFGYRAKVFHPKLGFHQAISNAIMQQYNEDSGSSSSTTTTAVPSSTPTPSPVYSKRLAVMSSFVVGAPTSDCLFLTADIGQGVDCRTDYLAPVDTVPWYKPQAPVEAGPKFPAGTWDLDLVIDGQQCEYKNDGNDPGALWCGERGISCYNDPADQNPNDLYSDKGYYLCGKFVRQPVFTCPY